jgi:2-amino-4-hydroxy-6-hydroxymethyldihydropteridine diphosphokinase
MKQNRVYLSLGSNLGNKYYYLLSGIFAISTLENTRIVSISKFYSTDPVGYTQQDTFLNCVIEIKTSLSPFKLLRSLQKIELDLKRERKIKWGPRTIDIDIISYDNLKLNTKDLILPHPRFKERNFVLIPLLDIIKDDIYIKSIVDYSDKSVRVEEKQPLLISGCLLGKKISYKGGDNYNYVIDKLLRDKFNLIDTCPEVNGGLPIPRISAERLGDRVINKEGTDVTFEFNLGGETALELVKKFNIKIALFKGKSPSCGINTIYNGNFSKTLIDGNGVAAEKLLKNGVDIIEVNKNE